MNDNELIVQAYLIEQNAPKHILKAFKNIDEWIQALQDEVVELTATCDAYEAELEIYEKDAGLI